MIRSLLLCLCLGLAQDAPPATASDPLEELVKKTNALEGFTAQYRMTDREGVGHQCTICYQSPDRAAVTMKSSDGAFDGIFRTWCIGGEIFLDSVGEARHFARVNVRELMTPFERVLEIDLRTAFPGAPKPKVSQFAPGTYVEWDWLEGRNGERPSTRLEVGWKPRRSHVCGWLENIQRRNLEPRETEKALVWELSAERVEIEVSKSTGFITRAKSTDPASKAEMVLESLDLHSPADELLRAPQSAPERAHDESVEMQRDLSSHYLDMGRAGIWTTLAKWIDEGQVNWDESSPAKLTQVFRAVHAEPLAEQVKDTLEKWRVLIDFTAGNLAARVRALGPDDDSGLTALTAERDRTMSDSAERFESEIRGFCDRFHAPKSVRTDMRLAAVFLECERDAIRAEYKGQVIDPLLAYFRESTDAALER